MDFLIKGFDVAVRMIQLSVSNRQFLTDVTYSMVSYITPEQTPCKWLNLLTQGLSAQLLGSVGLF